MRRRRQKVSGKGWATTAFGLGIAVSVAANVAHTWHPSAAVLAATGTPADRWRPEIGAQAMAAFYPLALLLTIEILARVPWPRSFGWAAARYGGAALVAGVAAIVSYRHMAGLLAAYGEDRLTSAIGPLSVDGLMVVSSFAMLAIGRHGAVRAAPVPVAEVHVPEPVPAVPRPVPEMDPDHVRAAQVFADDITAGRVPGIRAIKQQLRIGQARARGVRAYLTVLAAGEDRGLGD